MSSFDYDVAVIGGGPGGYVAAIRAAQLGNKVAIIESNELGGVCLNWGCIPTKALLKNAQIFDYIKNSKKYGINIDSYEVNWSKVIKRSRDVSKRLSKGIEYLIKKNKISYISKRGFLLDKNTISLDDNTNLKASKIIIATGSTPKKIPIFKIDGELIITSREAMVLEEIPKNLVIVGAGAIGVEFAHLYNTFGSNVTLIEGLDRIVPNEDEDISKELSSIFTKRKINVLTDCQVEKIDKNKNHAIVHLKDKDSIKADKVLIAVGVTGNIDNVGLEDLNISTENGFISVNEYMQTNIESIYAIGDVCGPPLLAHVASFEGVLAAEHLSGEKVDAMVYNNVPGCTYCQPEVASVGYTEKQALDKGYNIKVGRFPFSALGKALADGNRDGFVKIIYDEKYGELLGCHIIGDNATNIITEISIARNLETTYTEILKTIHPHPTLSEAIQEATAEALGEAIHI